MVPVEQQKGRGMSSDDYELYRHLDGRVSNLDERVTSMAKDTATIMAQLDNVAGAVNTLAKTVNEKNPTNWWALVSATVAVLTLMGTIGYMSLLPVSTRLDILSIETNEEIEQIWVEVKQSIYDRAKTEVYQDIFSKRTKENTDDLTALQERVSKLEAKTSAAEVSRRAIGDYAKETRAKVDSK